MLRKTILRRIQYDTDRGSNGHDVVRAQIQKTMGHSSASQWQHVPAGDSRRA